MWVEVVFLFSNNFCCNMVFMYCFVCKYWLIYKVIDCKDVVNVSMYLFINIDKVMFVNVYVSSISIN